MELTFKVIKFTSLKPKDMRPLLPIMSQWINHSGTLARVAQYGQLIIYLIVLGVIGFIYLGVQRTIANYLESLQIPVVRQL